MERAGEGLNENGVCGKISEATGFPEGQYSLNPAIPFFIEASLHHAAPQHREAKGSLRAIIGGFNTVFKKKDTEMGQLPVQMLRKPAHLILSTPVLVNQVTHAGIPCGNLALSRRCIGPLNQPAKRRASWKITE